MPRDPCRARRPPILRRPAGIDRRRRRRRWPLPRRLCPNGPRPAATTTIATAGSATSATSAMPGRPSKEARPMLDDAVRWVCARLLADGVDHDAGLPGRRQPRSRSLVPSDLPGYPGGSDVVGNRVRRSVPARSLRRGAAAFGERRLAGPPRRRRWDAAELAIRAIDRTLGGAGRTGSGRSGPTHWTHSRLICVAGLRAIAEHAPLSRHVARTSAVPGRPPAQRGRSHGAAPLGPLAALAATMHGSTPRFCSPRFAGRVAARGSPLAWPPAWPSSTSCARTTTSTAIAEPGEPLGQNRGRVPDLQLLDGPGLPRVRRDDRGGPMLREDAGIVQFERSVLRGVRRGAAAVARQPAPGLRARPPDRDRWRRSVVARRCPSPVERGHRPAPTRCRPTSPRPTGRSNGRRPRW